VSDKFLRETNGQTNFRVSLKVVGRALLDYMAKFLGMPEVMPLYRIEHEKDLGTGALAEPIGKTV